MKRRAKQTLLIHLRNLSPEIADLLQSNPSMLNTEAWNLLAR